MDDETDKVISGLIENKPGSRAEAAKELYRLCAENAELRKLLSRAKADALREAADAVFSEASSEYRLMIEIAEELEKRA